MQTRTLFRGVSVVATALSIAFAGVGAVTQTTGLVQLAAAQDEAAFAAQQAVVVDADALNVRADASIDGEIVATLANGTWATIVDGPIVGGEYTWYQIEYDDVTGWAAADFLIDAATAPALAAGDTVIVATDALNLRNAAGSTSEVLEILPAGTEGTVVSGPETADEMTWYLIEVDGVQGWVSRNYLALPVTGEATVTAGVLATATADAASDPTI